jgi:hypothetical protein
MSSHFWNLLVTIPWNLLVTIPNTKFGVCMSGFYVRFGD